MADSVADLRVVISADTTGVESGLKSVASQVSSFGDTFKQGLGMGAGFAAMQAGLTMVGSGFGALKSSVIDFNQQLDQSRAIFTRYFEGNTALADQFLNSLKRFAAETPFEFKDLSSLAVRLQSVGVNANDLIPTIRAIGNAASASGSLSQESIGRIGLAIQQMIGKGRVSAEEMNQLIEGGVTDAWKILAKEVGVTEAQVRKMTEAGEIAGTTMVTALRKSYENAGLMEGAAKSLTGALSTIRDVGTQAFADIGRGVYDLATEGANALAGFLSGDQFQTWVQAGRVAFEGIATAIRGIIADLAPVGQVIATAFGQLTSGDFSGAFATLGAGFQQALSTIGERVTAFASSMVGAGENVVGEFAAGIINGANSVLQGAVDMVASLIASFLIGNSPPPDGPLARIREGGANTIAAWGEGAASAADRAIKPAVDAIAGNLAELKTAGHDVDSAIRDIGRAMQDVEHASRDLKYTADDLKDAYRDQLEPLEAQLKALGQVNDLEADRHKLELSIEETQLRQAELAAQGDPRERARLQVRLDQLKVTKEQTAFNREQAQLSADLHGTETQRLKANLDIMKASREEKALKDKLKDAKGGDKKRILEQLKELEVRREIASAEEDERRKKLKQRQEDATARQEELGVKEQISGLADKEALARIKARQDEIRSEKESLGLQEQGAKLQRDLLALPLRQEIERIKAEQQATLKPIEDQIRGLERQKSTLTEQRQEWQSIKSEITAATSLIREQESASKAADKAAKEAAKNRPTPAVDKTFTPDALAEEAIKKAKDAGARLATDLRDGFLSWITANPLITGATIAGALFGAGQGAALGASLGSVVPVFGTAIGGVLGAGIGAAIGGIAAGRFASMLQGKLEEIIGQPIVAAIRQRFDALKTAFDRDGFGGLVTASLKVLADAVPRITAQFALWVSAAVDWATQAMPRLLSKLQEIGNGVTAWIGANARPIADKLYTWALALVGWAETGGLDLLSKLAALGGTVLSWIGENATKIVGKIAEWATAFVEWVGPKIPPLLTELGRLGMRMVEWMGTQLGKLLDSLGTWALAFVEWVGPKIPPLLAELAKLSVALGAWIVGTALPELLRKLSEWQTAITDWVAPRIPILIVEAGKLLAQLVIWMGGTALPAINAKLLEWGASFISWIVDAGPGFLLEAGKYLTNMTLWMTGTHPEISKKLMEWGALFVGWIAKDVLPVLGEKLDAIKTGITGWITDKVEQVKTDAARLGAGMLDGIADGFTDLGNIARFKDWLKTKFVDLLPGWLREMLGIHSPSTLMKPIGEALIDGIIAGMQDKVPMLKKVLEGIRGLMPGGPGGGGGGINIPTGHWADIVKRIGEEFNLNGGTFAKQLAVESINFDPRVISGETRSPMGARGIAQFMPDTAKMVAGQMGVSIHDFWASPILQIQGAARHMNDLLSMFNGDLQSALVGYNAGPGRAMEWRKHDKSLDWMLTQNWGAESRLYLKKILGLAEGGIVPATPGGMLARLGEGGRAEAVIPLPPDWMSGRGHGGGTQTVRVDVAIGGRVAEQIYVEGRDLAIRRGRDS